MTVKKNIVALLIISLILTMSSCGRGNTGGAALTEGEKSSMDQLCDEMKDAAVRTIELGDDVSELYTDFFWKSEADTFPVKFDLRERGTITPVKSQSPFGTCWSFATIAASETSILNTLGMTAEEYSKKYGEEMDLSEKHLAWFTANALPDKDEYGKGEYPYDEDQAGEGFHALEDSTKNIYDFGGTYNFSTSSLAQGIGINKEKQFPYESRQGTLEKSDDWSIDEDQRFRQSFELNDANLLPAPAYIQDDGSYKYRPEATEAIKSELISGRAVGMAFYADKSMPELSIEDKRKMMQAMLADVTNEDPKLLEDYIELRIGATDPDSLSEEEIEQFLLLRLRMNGLPEDLYDLKSLDKAQKAGVIISKYFGEPYDKLVEKEAEPNKTYMTFIGSDPVIYAQYTDEPLLPTHGVTIVGWDDTFSAENFSEGHRPPGDGVWIVKNSWGTDWGMDGYFYLSYYDQTLTGLTSFEYEDPERSDKGNSYSILEHDFMPASTINSVKFDQPVYSANIFEAETDSVLEHISIMTGDMDTTVTAYIYRLGRKTDSLQGGTLVGTETQEFRYAGYHRMDLSTKYALTKGEKIGVAVLERVPAEDGEKYAIVTTANLKKEGVEEFNRQHEDRPLQRYCIGIVNPGESYISFEKGHWIDWSDALEMITGRSRECGLIAYDNLPIKCYAYTMEDVESRHDLTDKVKVKGGEAAVCPECGFTVEY